MESRTGRICDKDGNVYSTDGKLIEVLEDELSEVQRFDKSVKEQEEGSSSNQKHEQVDTNAGKAGTMDVQTQAVQSTGEVGQATAE